MVKSSGDGRDYSVPALEKALDVLELLAGRREGLTQNQIAAAVGRSASEIFRTLSVLEQRSYLVRERPAGLYHLSMQLFELAHRHPPTKGLVQVAVPIMRRLAEASPPQPGASSTRSSSDARPMSVSSPGPYCARP